MRQYIPLIAVFLGLFSAMCIAYIAWELTSDKPESKQSDDSDEDRPVDRTSGN